MAADVAGTAGAFLLAARVLYAGVLGFMALNHFMMTDALTGAAEDSGLPAPRFLVVASGVTLLLGALAILLGAYPVIGAGAVAVFFVLVTPSVHDFWAVEDQQERMTQMQHFLKNMALLGAALAFLAIGGQSWAYSLQMGAWL